MLVFVLSCIINSNSIAQILNAERFYQSVDSSKTIKGDWDIGYSMLKQTSTLHKLQSTLNLTKKIGAGDLTLAANTFILRSDGQRIVDRSYGHLRYRFNPVKPITPELFTQIQWDGIRGMKHRYLFGANLRFKITKTDKGAAHFGIGAMNEREGWNHSGSAIPEIRAIDTLITTNVIKYNSYIGAYQDLTETLSIGITTYVQGKFSDPLSPRIAGIANVDFKITEHLRYSTSFDWFYDKKPVAPIQKLYFTLTHKLVIHIRPKEKE